MKKYDEVKIQLLVIEYKNTQDKKIIEDIIKECKPIIYKLSNQYIKTLSKESLEDLIQESYVILLKCLKSYKVDKNNKFTTYLYTCIMSNFNNKYKKSKLKTFISLESEVKCKDEGLKIIDILKDDSINLENDYINKELLDIINYIKEKYIDSTSDKKKKIYKDIYNNKTNKYISEKYNCSSSYVAKIKKELEEHVKKELKKILN